MARRARTVNLAIQERRNREARMRLEGKTLEAIAATVGVDMSTVSRDLKTIEAQWREEAMGNYDLARSVELARIGNLERNCWEAWEQSRQVKETTLVQRKTPSEEQLEQVRREPKPGEAAFLRIIQWCIAKRCELFGVGQAPEGTISEERIDALIAAMRATVPSEPPGGEAMVKAAA